MVAQEKALAVLVVVLQGKERQVRQEVATTQAVAVVVQSLDQADKVVQEYQTPTKLVQHKIIVAAEAVDIRHHRAEELLLAVLEVVELE